MTHPGRVSPRLMIAAAAVIVAVAGAVGVTQQYAFDQPSSLKYLLTIVGPFLVAVVVSVDHPLRVAVPLLLLVAPFGEFRATFGGVSISVVWPFLLLAVMCAAVDPARRPAGTSEQSRALLAMGMLITVPLLVGGPTGEALTLLGILVGSAWVAARLAAQPGGVRLILAGLVVSATVQSIIAFVQLRTGQQLDLYSGAGSSTFGRGYFFNLGDVFRPTGGLADPISLGNVLALGLPAGVALAVAARSLVARAAWSAASVAIAVALALTLSRMSWFAAIAGVALTVALLPRRLRPATVVAVGAACVAAVAIAAGSSGGELGKRFDSAFSPTKRSVETAEGDKERLRLWGAALSTAEEHPVTGVGIGRIRTSFATKGVNSRLGVHAHSTYFQVAAEAGALGLLALAIVLVGFAADVRRGLRVDRIALAAVGGAGLAMCVSWLTDYAIGYVPVAAVMACLFGAASGAARRATSRGEASP